MRTRKKKGRSEKGLGTLRPRGKNQHWYFRVELGGSVYTHPTGTPDLGEARAERDRFLKTIKASSVAKAPGHEKGTRLNWPGRRRLRPVQPHMPLDERGRLGAAHADNRDGRRAGTRQHLKFPRGSRLAGVHACPAAAR